MTSRSPIQILAHSPVATGSVVWRQGAITGATIIVKATFGLVPDGNARLVAPIDLVHDDRYRTAPGGIAGALDDANEIAPYLPSTGVIVHAVAHAPPGQPSRGTSVRLGVFRDAPLLNKVLHVIGNRTRETQASPQPFETMPLVYERAFGGPSTTDNPVGTGAQAGSPLPNIVDPTSPERPNGFGPIAKQWGHRQRVLGNRPEPTATELAEGLDWRWFHAAPPDQQIPSLKGNEWIVLDGMHPSHASLRTRLPDVRAHANWQIIGAGVNSPVRALELIADTLVLRPERQVCSVLWRGHVLINAADAALIQANVAIELAGYPLSPAFTVAEEPLYAATEKFAVAGAPGSSGTDPPAPEPATKPATKPPPAPPRPPEPAKLSPALFNTRSAVIDTRGSALPFKKAEPSSSPGLPALGSRAAKPSRPADLDFRAPHDDEGSTHMIDPDNLPARAAVPFPQAGHPVGPLRSAPTAVPQIPRDEDHATQLIDLDALIARPIAPFDLGAPGAPGTTNRAIPGAPWSPDASVTELEELTGSDLVTVDSDLPPPPAGGSRAPGTDDGSMTVTTLTMQPSAVRRQAAAVPSAVPSAVVPAVVPPAVVPSPRPSKPAEAQPVIAAPSAPKLEPPTKHAVEDYDDVTLMPTRSPLKAPASLPPPPPAPAPPDVPTGIAATVVARIKAGEPLADLPLAGADLRGLDLTGAVLTRVNLERAVLTSCKLVNARLSGAQLADTDLSDADLTGAELANADLSRAKLHGARLDGATLTDANLSSADGRAARFDGANAVRAKLTRGVWDEASFRRIEATGAHFTGAALADAHFDDAALAEARFDDTKAKGAVFDGARLSQANLTAASLVDARFAGVDAPRSIWERATLDGASFTKAMLKDANLSRANCPKASFAGADLSGANLQRLTGDGADFSEARLVAADLRQSRLHDATFVKAELRDALGGKADLEGCRFGRANLQNASLRGARLNNASLVRADLEGVDLRDAELTGANVFGASRKTAKLGAGAKAVIDEDPGDDPSLG